MTMITPSYLGETIEYSSLHACRSTLEDPTAHGFSPLAIDFVPVGQTPNSRQTLRERCLCNAST